MSDPAWWAMSDEEKLDWIDKIKRDANRAAREELGLVKPRGVPAGFEVEALPEGFVVEAVP